MALLAGVPRPGTRPPAARRLCRHGRDAPVPTRSISRCGRTTRRPDSSTKLLDSSSRAIAAATGGAQWRVVGLDRDEPDPRRDVTRISVLTSVEAGGAGEVLEPLQPGSQLGNRRLQLVDPLLQRVVAPRRFGEVERTGDVDAVVSTNDLMTSVSVSTAAAPIAAIHRSSRSPGRRSSRVASGSGLRAREGVEQLLDRGRLARRDQPLDSGPDLGDGLRPRAAPAPTPRAARRATGAIARRRCGGSGSYVRRATGGRTGRARPTSTTAAPTPRCGRHRTRPACDSSPGCTPGAAH